MSKKEIPIFLFNGFLDSGKTKLMKEILESDESYHFGKTLVILNEEGLEEFDATFNHMYGLNVVSCLDEESFNQEFVDGLVKKYKPEQIFMEINAFFNLEELPIPENGRIYQQVTTIDASTFEMYFNNMKQLVNQMTSYSTIIVFNRCDGVNNLAAFRRNIRAFNQTAQIGFEFADGKMRTQLDEDLPYDINQDHIDVKEEDYPIWYLDVFDNLEKYQGKTISYYGFVRDVTKDTIVVGRRIMTCCEADIAFYGFEVITDQMIKMNSFVKITGEVVMNYSEIAQEEVMMVKAHKIEILEPKVEEYLVFN